MQSDSTSGHVASVQTQNGNFRLDAVTVDEQVHHVLSINGCVIASSSSNLEIALADLALSGISPGQRYADVLIGGLGLGVTLRQVLKHRAVQSVCVVEIEPQIVEWNRTFLTNADLLNDARVELIVGDFCSYVQGSPRNYHGIAMHIDVGPDQVARAGNRQAYSLSMLRVLQMRLRVGGALAICGGGASYERALQRVFDAVSVASDPADESISRRVYQVIAQ
ncbi:MAG: hypothetical protein F4Y39_14970 [Gemmatimonadetes bacterium]|nr:hypothetical protein [Gemmatimonadota bacterium]